MATYVKDAGVWKPVNAISVKQSGVWKDVNQAFVQQGGVYKQYFDTVGSVYVSETVGGSPITTINEATGYYVNVAGYKPNNFVVQVKFVPASGYPFISTADLNQPALVSSSVNATFTNLLATVYFDFIGEGTVTAAEGYEYFVIQVLENGNLYAQSSMITVLDTHGTICRWPQWGVC